MPRLRKVVTTTTPIPPSPPRASPPGAETPLYGNLGSYHKAITTTSPVAQQYFDQGLRLTYGFNHDEAVKSFKEGIRIDSTCAMCWWGVANALGPNINLPMDTSAMRPAYEAIQQAQRYAAKATPRERAYIRPSRSATAPPQWPTDRHSTPLTPGRWAPWSPAIPPTTTRRRCSPNR